MTLYRVCFSLGGSGDSRSSGSFQSNYQSLVGNFNTQNMRRSGFSSSSRRRRSEDDYGYGYDEATRLANARRLAPIDPVNGGIDLVKIQPYIPRLLELTQTAWI